jgi:hypothetical protein
MFCSRYRDVSFEPRPRVITVWWMRLRPLWRARNHPDKPPIASRACAIWQRHFGPNSIFGAANSGEGSRFSTVMILPIVTRSMGLLVRRRRHGLLDGIRERNPHAIPDTHGGHGWDNFARNVSTSSRSALNRDPITTALREAFTNM